MSLKSPRSKISETTVASVFGKTELFCQSAMYKGNHVAVRSLQRKQVSSLTSKQELELAKVSELKVNALLLEMQQQICARARIPERIHRFTALTLSKGPGPILICQR